MWRTRFSKLWDWVRSRRLVGEDENHLFYSEFVEKGKPERRYVEFKDSNALDSSDRMPVEWWSWLHNRREDVPSEEEIVSSVRARERLAERVAEIEQEDERQRIRQMIAPSQESNPVYDTAVIAPSGIDEPNRANVAAARDELAARRRRRALERLQDASTTKKNAEKEIASNVETNPRGNQQSVRPKEQTERSDLNVSFYTPQPDANGEFFTKKTKHIVNMLQISTKQQGSGEDYQPDSWKPSPPSRRRWR